MSKRLINIMIVEDHKLIRVGIKTLFESNDSYNVIAEAETGKDAINKAFTLHPDVILLDIGLPDISGLKVLKEVLEQNNNTKFIILTSHENEDDILKSLSLGAFAYVLKDVCTDLLLYIVESVYRGAIWLDPKIVPIIKNKNSTLSLGKYKSRAEFKNTHANLTQREFEVLKLVVDGKSNNDIANELCISEHTAKAHVCNIIQKLVVDDRTQAAVKAIKEGLV